MVLKIIEAALTNMANKTVEEVYSRWKEVKKSRNKLAELEERITNLENAIRKGAPP